MKSLNALLSGLSVSQGGGESHRDDEISVSIPSGAARAKAQSPALLFMDIDGSVIYQSCEDSGVTYTRYAIRPPTLSTRAPFSLETVYFDKADEGNALLDKLTHMVNQAFETNGFVVCGFDTETGPSPWSARPCS